MTSGQQRFAKHLTLITLLAIFAAIGAARANETRFADTYIAKLAASVKPGEFVPFEPALAPSGEPLSHLLRGRRPDGGGAPAIDTWTDSAQWDPERKRAFFQGLRKSNRFLTYDALTNAWSEIDLDAPNAPPLFEQFGHLYGRTALDWKRGHYYRLTGSTLHRYIIDENRWEKFEDSPIGGYISIDWHYGLDMLVAANRRKLHGFRDGQWTALGRAEVHGYHSSAKYNPKRRDMLFIGGNHSSQTVNILMADGEIRRMNDAPFTFSIRADNLTHDPITGNYLVLHHSRILWEYSPNLDEWRVARDMSKSRTDWPFANGGKVPIAIDELDIIVWNHGRTAMAYRHRSVFSAQEQARALSPEPAIHRNTPVVPMPAPLAPEVSKSKEILQKEIESQAVPAPPNPKSIIEREASTMQPGEWRNIAHLTTWPGKDEGVSFKSFQYVHGIDGAKGGADGMGWTQNLVYHEGKLMMLLMRDKLERALMVMEADGRFWRINQPEGFDQRSHRRPFNKLTQDDTYLYYSPNIGGRANLGRMIRTPLDNPGVFESFGIPIGDSHIVGQFAATYVPEWGRFYAYTPGGKIWSWASGESEWTRHAEMPRDEHGHRLSGYAGLLLWNPVRKELIIAGGATFGKNVKTSHKVYRLTDPLGAPEMLEDRRFPDGTLMRWGSGGSKLIVDPRNGHYVQLTRGTLFHNNCAGGTFQVYEDLSESRPFGAWEPYAPFAHVPGTDVIAFLSHIRGLVLHRLKPLPPGTGPQTCPTQTIPNRPASQPSGPQTRSTNRPPQLRTDRPREHADKTHEPNHRPEPTIEYPQGPTPNADGLSSSAIRAARATSDDDTGPTPNKLTSGPASSAAALDTTAIRAIRNQATN